MRERVKEIALLLRIQAYRLGGVNQLIHGHDRRQRRRALGTLALALLLCAMAVAYSAVYALMMAEAGAADAIPLLLGLIVAALTLSIVVLKGPGMIFGGLDVPTLRALPVRTSSIVVSRLLSVLGPEWGFALLIGVPAAVVYGRNGAGARAAAALALGVCFIPAIPTTLALLVGTAAARVTLRMRHRAAVSAALSIALVCAVLAGAGWLGVCSGTGSLTESMLLLALGRVAKLLSGLYPPADWLAGAVRGEIHSWLLLVSTAGLSLLALALVASRGFARISDGLASDPARGERGTRAIRASSPLRSLYRKEWLRYTSSSIYLMNTSVGWLIYLLTAGALWMVDAAAYLPMIQLIPGVGEQAFWLLPLVPALLAGMSSVTACAVSMEGRQIEQMRALPVRMQDWLGAKLLLHMTLAVPAIMLGGAAIIVRLELSAAQAAMLIAYPLVCALTMGVIGLAFNLRFPNFDWNQEAQAVKSGVAVLLTMLAGMLMPVGVGALCVISGRAGAVMAAACALQLAASAVLWQSLVRGRMP